MGPITTLLDTADSLNGRTEAWDIAANRQPTFPTNGCANFLSAMLQLASLGVGTHMLAQDLAETLENKAGWHRVDLADYQAGDVGVTDARIDPPNADHIYLVMRRIDSNDMMVVDNQARTPEGTIHERTVDGSIFIKTPTHYFLRFGDDVAVSVNNTLIGDAGAYVHHGRSFGWIRPIAQALGATIGFADSMVTLSLAGQTVPFKAAVFGDHAFIALADLRQLNDVQVDYDDVNGIVNITRA